MHSIRATVLSHLLTLCMVADAIRTYRLNQRPVMFPRSSLLARERLVCARCLIGYRREQAVPAQSLLHGWQAVNGFEDRSTWQGSLVTPLPGGHYLLALRAYAAEPVTPAVSVKRIASSMFISSGRTALRGISTAYPPIM